MQKQRVLVIGSKDHSRADCVDWLETFPNIEEYDSIIINMQSLTPQLYTRITSKILSMREQILNIITTGREVFCIISNKTYPLPPLLAPGMPAHGIGIVNPNFSSPTNYDWFPFKIDVSSQKCGTFMNIIDSRFSRYFELLNKWEFEIAINYKSNTLQEWLVQLTFPFFAIAVNKSQKIIAGSLRVRPLAQSLIANGAIHLLPPPTKSSPFQAVETIIDLILGTIQSKAVQPWRKSIDVPNEKEIENSIQIKLNEMQKISEDIKTLQQGIQKWDSYRDLLSGTGDELELVVQKALSDIGINTNKTDKGFPADLIGEGVAIEVTGIKGFIGASSEKVNQIGRFHENFQKGEKIVFIANTFMDLPPQERMGKENFTEPITKYLESMSVCFMTTQTLFTLWKEVMLGKREQKGIREKILTTIGEIR